VLTVSADDASRTISTAGFDASMFNEPLGKKIYLCFARHDDANRLARQPKQKLSDIKMSMTPDTAIFRLDWAARVKDRKDRAAIMHN